MGVTFARGDTFARRVNFARMDTFSRRLICTRGYFARWVTFTRGDTFALRHYCTKGHFCTKGNFCKATFFHIKTIVRRHFLPDVTIAWRQFCKASLLHGFIFSRKYLCSAKILNNWSTLNGPSLLHAFIFLFSEINLEIYVYKILFLST